MNMYDELQKFLVGAKGRLSTLIRVVGLNDIN